MGREVDLDFARGRPRVHMLRLRPYGEPVRCAVEHVTDAGRGLVEMRIPRVCLRDPEWMRVSVSSVVWVSDEAETVAWDDALRKRPVRGDSVDRVSARIYAPE